jgi:hypothetical protein
LAFTALSTFLSARGLISICPGFASPGRRHSIPLFISSRQARCTPPKGRLIPFQAASPDVVFAAAYPPDTLGLVRAAHEVGMASNNSAI